MLGEIKPLSPGTEEIGEVGPEVNGGKGSWSVDVLGEVAPDVDGENGSLRKDGLEDVGPEDTVLKDPFRIDVPGEITELLLRSASPRGRSHVDPCVWILK